ncbi:hypothetical protein [Streptomyces sp. NPDC005336]|uniref:hypothetical protein n=1 Tax=Streptomyces sp. NPDC005336 TaxID=3157035 RepID=UPI0033B1B80E
MSDAYEGAMPYRPVVGVVGPTDLVEQIMHLGADLSGDGLEWRLVGVAYEDETEVARELARVEPDLDVCLFAGPLPYDLARKASEIDVPATFIPLSGSALYGTLLRAALEGRHDIRRLSVDSIPRREIEDAYTDIGLPIDDVHVLEYQSPDSPAEFVAFHEELYRRGTTTVALTSVRSVAHRLSASGVPVLRTMPTTETIRTALRTAALLGIGNRLEDSQIAIGIIEVPAVAGGPLRTAGDLGYQELRLALHRLLLDEARAMGATVLPRDDHSYHVVATFGSVVAATRDFSVLPFVETARRELGLDVELGIGLGMTARDAEANARTAMSRARGEDGQQSYVVGHDGHVLQLSGRSRTRRATYDDTRAKALDTMARLVDALRDTDGATEAGPVVVDATIVAELLAVTPRTARRLLLSLVELGLAWQMPPLRTPGPGRPRQTYRLLLERFEETDTARA